MADTTTDEFKEIVMEHPENGSQQAVSDIADFQRLSAYGWTEAKSSTKSSTKSGTKSSSKTAQATGTASADTTPTDTAPADTTTTK